MSGTRTLGYTSTHSATFVSDRLRLLLKILVQSYGLDPGKLAAAWSEWVDRAARTWLESGHLRAVVIEFHRPGATAAAARWDFPVGYGGTGFDDMWDDREFLRSHFAKAPASPPGSDYRVVLTRAQGAPKVPGVEDTSFFNTEGMAIREVGTVIATPHLTASARYYCR